MRARAYLQHELLQVIGRSHVLEYTPGQWEAVTCQRRKFFDWGAGWQRQPALRRRAPAPYRRTSGSASHHMMLVDWLEVLLANWGSNNAALTVT